MSVDNYKQFEKQAERYDTKIDKESDDEKTRKEGANELMPYMDDLYEQFDKNGEFFVTCKKIADTYPKGNIPRSEFNGIEFNPSQVEAMVAAIRKRMAQYH